MSKDDLVGHPRFGDNGGRDEIELFLRDAYAAGANAAYARSLVTAMEYAAREAPKLRELLRRASVEGASPTTATTAATPSPPATAQREDGR